MNPWEDKDAIVEFIDQNWQHVTEWCEEKNLNSESFENQYEYCNFYRNDYLEFYAEYEQDLKNLDHEEF